MGWEILQSASGHASGATGERSWLEPLPGSCQQEAVTEALVFGRIVQLLDSSGKAKELPGREHWGRRAMKADQSWRWEESQEWALQMHS